MIYFFLASFFFFGLGIYRLWGPVSVTYLAYGSMLKGGNYFALLFSLTCFLCGLALSSLIPDDLKLTLVMIGVMEPFVFAYPAAKFLKPKWLHWLERTHSDLFPIIPNEIEKMGPDVWDKQINTKEELESWVNDLRQVYGENITWH